MSYFNNDQLAEMSRLEGIPAEDRCWCGWYRIEECGCGSPRDKTCADKLAARCPECGNAPTRPGDDLIHISGCSRSIQP